MAFDSAPTPADVPMCVYEFAQHAVQYINLQRKFDLLNVYYEMAARGYDESGLQVHQGLGAAVADLWDWFIQERQESEADGAETD